MSSVSVPEKLLSRRLPLLPVNVTPIIHSTVSHANIQSLPFAADRDALNKYITLISILSDAGK